jgi:hypothetical protein
MARCGTWSLTLAEREQGAGQLLLPQREEEVALVLAQVAAALEEGAEGIPRKEQHAKAEA